MAYADSVSGGLSDTELAMLYEKYSFLLIRRLRVLLRDESLAQDVLHDGFLKLMQSGGALREAQAPLRWLYRVFDNLAIDRLRTRRARGQHESIHHVGEDRVGPAPGVDVEGRDAVVKLLGELGEDDARIAILVFVDRLTQEEAAGELGLSRVTINKRVKALRERASVFLRGEEQHA
ncbi:sigma-70 family RNA polymerase sigma factor [Pendulispora brunnea]|uniref:Sigma-70 family RNA polymerase sigma factor n=1 Tax=Pendulispora brunnea TaxID=2905690 RepID=A0ABZ2KMA2_9BACT